MESFGRMIAVMCGILGMFFCILFYRTAAVGQQRRETVQSISDAFVQRTLRNKMISETEWTVFLNELSHFGIYRTELTVFERRQYETENVGRYLFVEKEGFYGQILPKGSYIRLVVTEEEKKGAEIFLFGSEFVFFAGGRIE